ncbi:ABC transporter ATP-binding protein [Clostridium sporogenes]|nr:ABC transporter ATP-binding protein [Clostridium sporogenes]STC72644.1 multidrug ABC transporter ATPase and permease [Clostridium botulinum]MCW6087214.1 ABC transporter ATP-binding protein/permease [Clostridium sporogenes]NFF68494.1 ABC transporter ATP-binding protein [Clostridium sporogenes]NFF99719.1 ABC transporter ATP-binding protein [Clostridium sporogenes]NFG05824.1 ABC transporter ATP-binding protein [Clostridium sporogenes]
MRLNIISKSDKILIKRALNYIKPYKTRFSILFLCILFNIIFGLVQPLIWGNLITDIFNSNHTNVILNILYVSILYVLQLIISYTQSYLFIFLNNNIICNLKNDMFNSILNLPIKAFDEISVGEFMSRLHNDTSNLANIITEKFLGTIIDILKIIIIGILVFKINFILALTVVIFFPFSYFIFIKYGKKLRKKNKQLQIINDNYFSSTQETLLSIKEIKSIGISNKRFNLFFNLSNKLKGSNIDIGKTSAFSQIVSQGINLISQIAILIIGTYLIFKKKLSIAYFIAFSNYSIQFSTSLINISNLNSSIQQSLASLERIFGLMDNLLYLKETPEMKLISHINSSNIEFNNVSFEYKENLKVLNNISFTVPQNKKTAIVGPSGSGKSTIFDLLLNFYKPTTGHIKVGNFNIQDISYETLISYISIVRQEPFLFNMSIKENLLISNPYATTSEIENACKKAYIHDYINSLPNKYDTAIVEGGVNISCGQKQRIAIARALLKNSKIILFDEVTSSLDNESQYYINKSIDEISENKTVIIIAHRLSTIMNVDQIIVLNKGTIVGSGRHSDLVKENEFYINLYNSEVSLSKD